MESATEQISQELGLQRLWGRRLTSNNLEDEELTVLLDDREAFPTAKVDEFETVNNKSRSSSPAPLCLTSECYVQDVYTPTPAKIPSSCAQQALRPLELDGSQIGDIPARYQVFNLKKHEFPAIGVYVDPRIVPGYKYKVRPIQENGSKEKWLFKGEALELQSIGRGYSRRLTFAPGKGNLNSNPNYFWADSSEMGYAFELELVSSGDKFTVYNAYQVPVGTLEFLQNQMPQEEVGHRILSDGSVEKTARVKSFCKVEWYEEESELIVPMSGIAVSIKNKRDGKVKTKMIGVTVGSHPRRCYSLTPGINTRLRHTVVKGNNIGDVPTSYNIIGLETYELPVIGTYIDPRIVPGFHYRVRPAAGKRRPFFGGQPLELKSIGMGYGKRLVFESNNLNNPDNFMWSDSHPDGLGFEPSAVRAGMSFEVLAGQLRLGEAVVFRADAPQYEKKQQVYEENGKKGIVKEVHVDLTCQVSLDTTGSEKEVEPHTMRVSGTAILAKAPGQSRAKLLRVENIGLDSQLNILFATQWDKLVFIPL
ncbi:uncharacterized protein [Halyomorpha halys]|uniref:uncharacterized protein isoform X1 n=1 Tax=Halyomorpha halys TaxID=286706 RepID=UPI0006D4F8E9|nr:uncharacterized protein LOC106682215 isoform X1 [Halyomorpha halys]